MNCQQAAPLAHAYADGELDLVRVLDLEEHLATCPACSRGSAEIKALKAALKPAGLYFSPPPQLEQQLRRKLRLTATTSESPWWSLSDWLKLLIPVTCSAMVALFIVAGQGWNSGQERLAQEVAASHVRSLMAEHKTDVASSNQHTVKPWFDGKLDFAPPVLDLSERGFPLIGGRLDYLQNRPVAALVYQRQKHVINLFIWPDSAASNSGPQASVVNGYNLIHWRRSGMTFWAVSDLNRVELENFAKMID